jgi:hypothetical protein
MDLKNDFITRALQRELESVLGNPNDRNRGTDHVRERLTGVGRAAAAAWDAVFTPTESAPADRVLAERICALLNDLHALDPTAVQALIDHRVPCNAELGEHPTVQCGSEREHDGHRLLYRVGMLGILNGLCGVDARGWGLIAAVYDDANSRITGFKLLDE